ncbi:MAG: S8 family serine peptidase [Nitrospirae bacterium]|nr:S8 family serine peptidase [Nitrospirota bacterium]
MSVIMRLCNSLKLICAVVISLSIAAPAWAAEPSAALKGKVIGGYSSLSDKLTSTGAVRIIVKLGTQFKPMGGISKPEAISQAKAISQAQDKLLLRLASSPIVTYHKFKYIPYIAMTVGSDTLNAVVSTPEVESIVQDHLSAATAVNWDISTTGASNVWSYGYDGTGYAVAVLDTGVDSSHPMLKGKVIAEACYSTNDSSVYASSVCPGGVTDSTATGAAMPYAGNCPINQCDHGTSVAGFAAGKNTGQSSGVAKGASLIAMQVFTRFDYGCPSSNSCLLAYNSDVIKGLERVYELSAYYPIAAVNISTAGGHFQTNCDNEYSAIKAMVDILRTAGITTVSASGNTGYIDGINGPACISTVVSVGATTSSDTVAFFSNSASFLNMLAPGYEITGPISSGRYMSWDGTSMASPHVAGAVAILKQARPSASVSDIIYALENTGVQVSDYRSGIIKPRLNVSSAIQKLAGSVIYYMPYFPLDNTTPTYCWVSNKSAVDAAAKIQIMSSSSSIPPTQTPLSKTLSFPAKQSKMITFSGTTITDGTTSIDISTETGSGSSTAYSADVTFISSVALNCTQLEMSCFQGTTTPKRSLVGYTCNDGTYRNY